MNGKLHRLKDKIISTLLVAAMVMALLPMAGPIAFASGSFDSLMTLEIRKGSLNGPVVADLKNPSGTWVLERGEDHYLYGEFSKSAGADYLQIRFGGGSAYNGLTFFNPPGGTYTAGAISHDYLDQLVSYTQFDDPTYGSKPSSYTLQDGVMLYHVKDNVADNSPVNFAMGMILDDNVLGSATTLSDALQVSVGSYANGVFTAAQSMSYDLNLAPKGECYTYFGTTARSAALDKQGEIIFFAIKQKNTDEPVGFLYNTITFEVVYPKGAALDIGLNNSFVKSQVNYGTLTVENPVTDGDNQRVKVTVTNGYKPEATTLVVNYALTFPSASFTDGQKPKTGVENVKITLKDGSDYSVPPPTTKVTYTILDTSKDHTTMSKVDRSPYNQTISGAGEALINMGAAYIKNGSTATQTPYDKTYEASFNTGGTAAVISTITVPCGTDKNPAVTVMGRDANGQSISKTVDNPAQYKSSTTWDKSTYLLLKAEDFGLTTFTGVKADIGRLRAGYATASSTGNWGFGSNAASAYGYFTTPEAGLQVKNTYRFYNTDPARRNLSAGDLTVDSLATSLAHPRVGLYSAGAKITNAQGKVTDSVEAGGGVTVSGYVHPYAYPTVGRKNGIMGNMSVLYRPVIYLTLPQGIRYETLEFGGKSFTVENISYQNTTGDGVSIYKVTFSDPLTLGYYSGDKARSFSKLDYTITLTTSKSLETRRYELNELIGVSAETPVEAMPYNNNPGALCQVIPDKYGINGGLDYAGITKTSAGQSGFGLQQLAEINVYDAVSVTKVNGTAVPEQWYTYEPSNPNSIASLGKNCEGRFRLTIENTSDTAATNLNIAVPIPKQGTDLGNLFMDAPGGFDMSMTYTETDFTGKDFTVSYVTLTPQDNSGNFTMAVATKDTANAILLTAANVPARANYEFYFDFSVQNGAPQAQNIWRNAFYYTTSDSVTQNRTGNYVASAIAPGKISGTVFHDENRNGTQDVGEAGIPGVTVVAKDGQNKILSAVTDANGGYEFLAVREESVALRFTVPQDVAYRFNAEQTGTTLSPDGLQAEGTVIAGANTTANMPMSGYVTLTYHGNGAKGTLPEQGEYIDGAQAAVAVKPDDLLKTGCTFKEWNTQTDGKGTGYQPGEAFAINTNTDLYAIWEIGTYNIYFNYRGATGGNTITGKTLTHNQPYNTGGALPVPTKVGYTFAGWCSTSTGTAGNVKNTTKFTLGRDTTLYALWTAKTGYTVRYDTAGGSAIDERTVGWETHVLPSETPAKAGYTFAGWSFGGKSVADTDAYGSLARTEQSSITLTAQWTAKGGYTVHYDLNGGTGGIADLTNVSWDDANLLPTENPTKTGFAFAGWNKDNITVTANTAYSALAVMDTVQTVALTAQWTAFSSNTVHYNTGGGTVFSDKTGVQAADKNLIPASDPVRKGYTFAGWTCNGTTVTTDTVYSALSSESSITISADWAAKTYTVSYDTGGFTSITKYWSDNGLLPAADPVKDGSTFGGWYYNGKEVTAALTVASLIPQDDQSALTLTAKWVEDRYTVVYDSNGGTYTSPKTNVGHSQAEILPETNPTRLGYTFTGWKCGGTDVTKDTTCGSLAAAGSSTVTLTAQWTAKGGFIVNYNSAGGTAVAAKTGVSWTDTGLLPATAPNREGYTFGGWVHGRASVTDSTAYGALAATEAPGSSITLVAQWSSGSYTVHYDTDGGTEIPPKFVSWNSTSLLPIQTPEKADYIFEEWQYDGKTVSTSTTYSDLAAVSRAAGGDGAITLKAVYKPVSTSGSGGGMGTDVQGKVIEHTTQATYKIDLSWGEMKFVFNTDKDWNPELHEYETGTQGIWENQYLDGANNKIVAENHSNGDLEMSFDVMKEGVTTDAETTGAGAFENVTMAVRRTNADDGELALAVLLPKVPQESAAAPSQSVYFRLNGEPNNISFLNTKTYTKIATIVATFEPTGGPLTPKTK